MRCDPNPLGCGPCKQKNLPCVTTDRISGRPSERGHVERLESEIHALRQELGAYASRYGHLDSIDLRSAHGLPLEPSPAYTASNGYSSDTSPTQHLRKLSDFITSTYPSNGGVAGPHAGPIRGTKVSVCGQEIDVADFDCPEMDEPKQPFADGAPRFNNSRLSFLNTVLGSATPPPPKLPEKETALTYAKYYNVVVGPYAPVLHCPSLLRLVENMYKEDFRPTAPEKVMFFVVMAIITHQMAVRNPSMAKVEFEKSNQYFHYSLSHFSDLMKDPSLLSMQALAMLLVHARNLPKPGYSWALSKIALTRAVEMNMHRSVTKLDLKASQQFNPLEVEIRKRVFWVILKKVVTSGVKLCRPMPMDMSDLDIEFPEALLDSEISEHGIVEHRSGRCNFWTGLHVIRQIPLWIDLYNNIIKRRKPAAEYIHDMQNLEARLVEWKKQCDEDYAKEAVDGHLQVATYFAETWYAEFRLSLHHPLLCTSTSPEVMERNLDLCHEAALNLLRVVQALFEKFKGADFTWHTTVMYVLAAGLSIDYYSQRKSQVTPELFRTMDQELRQWLHMMKIAGAVLGSGDQLIKFFRPLVDKCLKESQSILIASTALRDGTQPDTSYQGLSAHSTPNGTPYTQQISRGSPADSAYKPSDVHRFSNGYSGEPTGHHESPKLPPPTYTPTYDHPKYLPRPTNFHSPPRMSYTQDSIAPSVNAPYLPLNASAPQGMACPSVNASPYGGPGPIKMEQSHQHPANTLLDLSLSGYGAGNNGFLDDGTTAGMWPNIIWHNGP